LLLLVYFLIKGIPYFITKHHLGTSVSILRVRETT
jgi:hypothetical protein